MQKIKLIDLPPPYFLNLQETYLIFYYFFSQKICLLQIVYNIKNISWKFKSHFNKGKKNWYLFKSYDKIGYKKFTVFMLVLESFYKTDYISKVNRKLFGL